MENSTRQTAASLVVPFSVEMEDGYLVSDQTQPNYALPKPTLLANFLRIRTDPEILDFARKWGTLGICEKHLVPGCRTTLPNLEPCWPEQVYVDNSSAAPVRVWREPVGAWHSFIALANAIRRIGENIQQGGAGSRSDWVDIMIPEGSSAEQPSRAVAKIMAETGSDYLGQPWKSVRSARLKFSWIMQAWLDLGNIRPHFIWHEERWTIRNSIPVGLWPLFGHLALGLAIAIAGGMQSAFCSFCGREYFPERRPSPGQRNCCGDAQCRRDYWRENKRLRAAGKREE